MEAVILAGGLGTRLRSVVQNVPKPMADVSGRPFLSYLLDYLEEFGIKSVILSVGYLHEMIETHFGTQYHGIQLTYSIENEPLGTGGAIKKALTLCKGNEVIVLNGDSFFDVNLYGLLEVHKNLNADLTMALKEMVDFDRYGTVQTENGRIINFVDKKYQANGKINGGVYVLKRSLLDNINLGDKFSFETDFLQVYYDRLYFATYESSGYFIDIGIPEDYQRAQVELRKLR
jgi:D-glycero-alpha-D-manno-heptose 1-phosphate guanylyltransferase